MTSIKGPTHSFVSEAQPAATATEVKKDAPGAVPVNQLSSQAPTAGVTKNVTPPPMSPSEGLGLIAALRNDPSFGQRPNAKPGIDLVDPGFQFDPKLLEMDLGAWFADEIRAHPDSERAQQMKVLIDSAPDGLSALDPALIGELG